MLNWSIIDTVLLDMDGTLLDLHFDSHFWRELVPQRYAEQHQLELSEARRIIAQKTNAVSGSLQWYCLDYWQQELSLDILGLKQEISHLITVRDNVFEFLQRLRDTQRQVVMLTNAHPDGLSLKMERTALTPYFDALISTHELGHPKESQQSWQQLTRIMNFDPRRTLFVDDSLVILNAARQFGIGQLLGINTPDSRQAKVDMPGVYSISDYAEILEEIN